MTRRLARNGLRGNSVSAWSMAPLIEVPPPNNWRGTRSIAAAKAAAVCSSPTALHSATWTCIIGPVHCTMVTAIAWCGPDRMACSTRAWRKAAT